MPPASPETAPSRRPGRPRQDDPSTAEVRERLLDAATQLAVEQGFEACGLREIAARAEVSSGMIAYYFGDRRGLYDAMFDRALERVGKQVESLLGDSATGIDDGLGALVRIQINTLAADPWLPQLILRELLGASDPKARATLADRIGDGPLRNMIAWLEDEKERGYLRDDLDPKLTALTLGSLSSLPFLILPLIGRRIGLELDEDFPARLIEHNLKLLTHGIRARPEETE